MCSPLWHSPCCLFTKAQVTRFVEPHRYYKTPVCSRHPVETMELLPEAQCDCVECLNPAFTMPLPGSRPPGKTPVYRPPCDCDIRSEGFCSVRRQSFPR